MSLTEAQEVFAGIHEDAINDVLTAFCTDRPRYLVYGSPAFVPATTVAETAMPSIGFPGVPGGIQWRIRLGIPRIDLFPKTTSLPPELSLGAGQFSARLSIELCVECRGLKLDPKPPRPHDGEKPPRPKDDRPPPSLGRVTCCKLEVFAVGHLEHVIAITGEDAIAFAVDGVEIVDIAPDELESVLECILFQVLQAVLAEIRLPLPALRAGAFQLTVATGSPFIEGDQIKARGTF